MAGSPPGFDEIPFAHPESPPRRRKGPPGGSPPGGKRLSKEERKISTLPAEGEKFLHNWEGKLLENPSGKVIFSPRHVPCTPFPAGKAPSRLRRRR